MGKHFHKSSGISLITGSLLIIATMGLHPTGGSIEYIIKITKSITATHSWLSFHCQYYSLVFTDLPMHF